MEQSSNFFLFYILLPCRVCAPVQVFSVNPFSFAKIQKNSLKRKYLLLFSRKKGASRPKIAFPAVFHAFQASNSVLFFKNSIFLCKNTKKYAKMKISS